MSHPLAEHLYVATPGGAPQTQPVYRRVLAEEFSTNDDKRKVYEKGFRDAVAANPGLVMEPCRAADRTEDQWYLWGVEHQVTDADGRSIGSIDVLLISSSGRIGIVETKLAYNPGRRRGVVAQVLDYAVHFPELDPDQMPLIPPDANVSREDMAEHLAQGDFLLIIAGDEIDPRALKLSQAIMGDHMLNQWELALVDLTLYERTSGDGPACIIVPNLRGMLLTETRNVVRVDVGADGERLKVKIERVPPAPVGSSSRQRWTEDRFFTELNKAPTLATSFKALATRIRELVTRDPDRLSLSWGTGQTGSMTLKRDDQGLVEA